MNQEVPDTLSNLDLGPVNDSFNFAAKKKVIIDFNSSLLYYITGSECIVRFTVQQQQAVLAPDRFIRFNIDY